MNILSLLGISKLEAILIAGVAAVLIAGGAIAYVYHKGENAGSSKVESAVEKKAVEEIDTSRKQKEKADENAKRAPDGDLIDRTR